MIPKVCLWQNTKLLFNLFLVCSEAEKDFSIGVHVNLTRPLHTEMDKNQLALVWSQIDREVGGKELVWTVQPRRNVMLFQETAR